jgi:superfamily II helicase
MTDDMRQDPVEDGALEATDDERIDGIVEQVRADILVGTQSDVESLLRQRLDDAAVVVTDDQFVRLLGLVNA